MAMFQAQCPKCGTSFEADTDWIGQEGECPSCGASITIEAPLKKVSAPKLKKQIVRKPSAKKPIAQGTPSGNEEKAIPAASGKFALKRIAIGIGILAAMGAAAFLLAHSSSYPANLQYYGANLCKIGEAMQQYSIDNNDFYPSGDMLEALRKLHDEGWDSAIGYACSMNDVGNWKRVFLKDDVEPPNPNDISYAYFGSGHKTTDESFSVIVQEKPGIHGGPVLGFFNGKVVFMADGKPTMLPEKLQNEINALCHARCEECMARSEQRQSNMDVKTITALAELLAATDGLKNAFNPSVQRLYKEYPDILKSKLGKVKVEAIYEKAYKAKYGK